jgi:hypothetical protein
MAMVLLSAESFLCPKNFLFAWYHSPSSGAARHTGTTCLPALRLANGYRLGLGRTAPGYRLGRARTGCYWVSVIEIAENPMGTPYLTYT